MGKIKELVIEVERLLHAGLWPVEIQRMTGAPMEMILQIEEDWYESNDPRNYGPDYDE